jgi:acyl-CoA synthetase (AMP-forming)/AMP-acid ligase II
MSAAITASPGRHRRRGRIPIGKACPYAQLTYLWDTPQDSGSAAGELLVAGDSLMTGYWNREAATERAMFRDASGTRFYRTGDYVRGNAQGDLVFLGRRDRQVKVQGRRIQLDEIESTLQKHFSSAEIACTRIKQDGADPFIVAAITGGAAVGNETSQAIGRDQLPLFIFERIFALEAPPQRTRQDRHDALTRCCRRMSKSALMLTREVIEGETSRMLRTPRRSKVAHILPSRLRSHRDGRSLALHPLAATARLGEVRA